MQRSKPITNMEIHIDNNARKKVGKFIKTYNELLSIPIALVLFFTFPRFYRQFDATAGAWDAGYLHILVFVLTAINLFSGVSWILMRLNFPIWYKYFDDNMEQEVLEDIGYRKALFPLTIYFLYFLAMLVVLVAMI